MIVERSAGQIPGWPDTRATAVFSDDMQYRYRVRYRWNASPLLYVCMANPSTATHLVLDPTVRGMCQRARAWGHGGLVVVNCFAYRATDPRDMRVADDPVGPDNMRLLAETFQQAARSRSRVIAGWGKIAGYLNQDSRVVLQAQASGIHLWAIAVNSDGSPKHPLYIKMNKTPEIWS